MDKVKFQQMVSVFVSYVYYSKLLKFSDLKLHNFIIFHFGGWKSDVSLTDQHECVNRFAFLFRSSREQSISSLHSASRGCSHSFFTGSLFSICKASKGQSRFYLYCIILIFFLISLFHLEVLL